MQYIPKRYIPTPRDDMKLIEQSKNMLLILQEIFERIIYTDDRLKYGVGNAALEKVIVELGKKEYHSKTWKHASYGCGI